MRKTLLACGIAAAIALAASLVTARVEAQGIRIADGMSPGTRDGAQSIVPRRVRPGIRRDAPRAAPALQRVNGAASGDARWAGVAVSIHVEKDAVGWDYIKDMRRGAVVAAKGFCVSGIHRYNEKVRAGDMPGPAIENPRCTGDAGPDWVIGMYCSDKLDAVASAVGLGASPADAANDVLQKIGNFPVELCVFTGFRHARIDKKVIIFGHWSSEVTDGTKRERGSAANGRAQTAEEPEDSAALRALNDALIACDDVVASQCQVLAFEETRGGSNASRVNGRLGLASALIGRAEASEQPVARGRSAPRTQMAVVALPRSNAKAGGPVNARGTFCVEQGIFSGTPKVRFGSCRPEGGGCTSLATLRLGSRSGKYMCGSTQTDMNRRFSFPQRKGDTKRFYGRKQGTIVYFNRSSYR